MKPSKRTKEAHTANTKYGMGDYYGQAIRNPVGTMKRDYLNDVMPKSKITKPPKALA